MTYPRKLLGVFVGLVTAALLSTPFGLGVMLIFMFAGSYDASGAGAPFKSCTEETTDCSGPNVLGVITVGLLLAVLTIFPSAAGVLAGNFSKPARAFWALLIVTITAYGVGTWHLLGG
ncbi:hypothetical protein [Pseudoclavibacter helvolus]|uniref:Uncharacterized protein n=1 Tax=Pseudoclavibacter helvolus TaxID=255205 RepID=A0A7W4UKS9_9MICO|nr:hypothetical protein [Pseudoclavibacter helvolus]MBB2956275.1 hypothetical protein [Pseudoclavibacter helvolus]